MHVGAILREPIRFHNPGITAGALDGKVAAVMEQVGIDPDWQNRYPHEFSGGQRQRISIARALAVDPEFIVADEPIAALDVSIQAQILNLMMDLQAQHGLTYLFISHDLSVVEHISDRVAVMYLGALCELAPAHTLFTCPRHPYTQALLSAIPRLGRPFSHKKLSGDVPTPIRLPGGIRQGALPQTNTGPAQPIRQHPGGLPWRRGKMEWTQTKRNLIIREAVL